MSVVCKCVPLFDEKFEILVHVNFELGYALCRKGMRDGLSLSSMLDSVSCVEETSLD